MIGIDQEPDQDKWCWLCTSEPTDLATLRQLKLALYYGAPFAAWWDPAHQAAAQGALTSHSYLNVRELRQEVARLNSSAQPFTCLIDDPARTPVDQPLEQPI